MACELTGTAPYIGLDPEAFRFLIAVHGEQIEWWKGMPCICYNPRNNDYARDGTRLCPWNCRFGHQYEKKTLDTDVRAFIQQVKREYVDPTLGLIQQGDATVAVMPDELPLSPPDMLVLMQRQLIARETVYHAGMSEAPRGVSDALLQPHTFAVTEVLGVRSTDTDTLHRFVPGTDYLFDAEERKLVWLDASLPVDHDVPRDDSNLSVESLYHPIFWFLGVRNQAPRPSAVSDVLLPLRGILTLQHPVLGRAGEIDPNIPAN